MKGTLIDQIETDALDPSVPLATALRKCVSLGGRAKSSELRDWASQELRGYEPGAEDLPSFRRVGAILKADSHTRYGVTTGQVLTSSHLPEFAREALTNELAMSQGVGELEALVAQAQRGEDNSLKMVSERASDLAAYMSNNAFTVDVIYHEVSASVLAGVLDQIRTALTALVAEMREGPADAAGVPTAEAAAQAVNVVVNGKRNRVKVSSEQVASGEAPSKDPAWWKRWQAGAGVIGGLATLTGAGFFLQRMIG